MRHLFLVTVLFISHYSFAQSNHPKTYLFVPGAWDGGWDYAVVDSILTAKGEKVYRPTLTGLGERVHLASPNINLTTYINDIVNVIRFENLNELVLVGHSFGGMVISGVAELVPDRISQLIYLDAMVPENGESAKDVCGELWSPMTNNNISKGMMLYPFGAATNTIPSDVPQPLTTFTEPLKLNNPLAKKIPAAFIVMTKNGQTSLPHDKMGLLRAKARKWKIIRFEGGHYSMREQPANLVVKLEEVFR